MKINNRYAYRYKDYIKKIRMHTQIKIIKETKNQWNKTK